MPYLSAFTPLGLLMCSSAPSHAERFYYAQLEALGGQFRAEEGDHVEATIFARAIGLGVAKRVLEHAGDQQDPALVQECIEYREGEYGAIPSPRDNLTVRRARLAALRRAPKAATAVNIATELRELVGDAFVAFRPTEYSEAAVDPPALGDQPMNLQPAEVARKNIRILDGVSANLGSPKTVMYDDLDPNGPTEESGLSGAPTAPISTVALLVGDTLVVDPGHNMQRERVVVTAAGAIYDSSEARWYRTFTATFTKAHDADIPATTMPWPFWRSTKRQNLVVLTLEGASDAETRRKVNERMARMLRGVSTWQITAEETAGQTGPFTVGGGLLGVTTIGAVSL
jgi:hypothetical protein